MYLMIESQALLNLLANSYMESQCYFHIHVPNKWSIRRWGPSSLLMDYDFVQGCWACKRVLGFYLSSWCTLSFLLNFDIKTWYRTHNTRVALSKVSIIKKLNKVGWKKSKRSFHMLLEKSASGVIETYKPECQSCLVQKYQWCRQLLSNHYGLGLHPPHIIQPGR